MSERQIKRFIGHVHEVLDDERIVQGLSQTDVAKRAQIGRVYFGQARAKLSDLRLSTVARYAHTMGKRAILVLVDEVPE